ncbi:MAG TPA: ACT domain-containing protein [Thermoanaerobaculia bacterium]
MTQLRITILPLKLAVSRLDPRSPLPHWATGEFVSLTRTKDELSVVCDDAAVPPGVHAERDWGCFRVEGPIPFEVTGVASALTAPLAAAGISVFLIATYDTDYLLVKSEAFDRATLALRGAGHDVR